MLKHIFLLLTVFMLFLYLGCSEKQTDSDSQSTETSEKTTETTGQVNKDSVLIQEMFNEAAARWHAGDKAVLYDMDRF